jgi:hypothetical protein
LVVAPKNFTFARMKKRKRGENIAKLGSWAEVEI